MKRLVLILALLISTSAFAANGTGIQIKTGLLMGNTNDSMSIDSSFKNMAFAPSLILGFEFSLNKAISFEVGAGAVMHTMDYVYVNYDLNMDGNFSDSTSIEAGKTRLVYLTVPVYAKFMAPTEAGGVYLSLGGKLDFLMGVDSNRDENFSSQGMVAGKDDFKSVNVGLGGRIGGEIAIGKHHMLLESGYDFGLNDILDAASYRATKGQFTLLSIGFRFNTDYIDE